jgi:hypothetical protein
MVFTVQKVMLAMGRVSVHKGVSLPALTFKQGVKFSQGDETAYVFSHFDGRSLKARMSY